MEEDNATTKFESMVYRLRKEFDPLYVGKDGVWRIIVALVLTGTGTVLTAFLIALVALATHRLGL